MLSKLSNYFSFYYLLKTFNHLNKVRSFVQVGAHDGVMHDPLVPFLSRNKWNGIIIEPQKKFLNKFKSRYKNRTNLSYYNVAVHPTLKKVELFKFKKPKNYSQTGWATVLPNQLKTQSPEELSVKIVKALPLMKIINDSNYNSIDLLQIDTEGFDYEVLKMFDFNTYRPVIIQYEHFHLSMEEQINSNRLLAKNGYCILKKKNDTIGIKKSNVTSIFIIYLIIFRAIDSLKSRINKKSH